MCAQLFLSVLLFASIVVHGSCLGMDDDLDHDDLVGLSSEVNPHSMFYQSPIDLESKEAYPIELSPLMFKGHWTLGHKPLIKNNDETVEIGEASSAKYHAALRGGPLHGTYKFSQAHFHWGNRSSHGSEHTINGHQYSMEVHFVHHHSKYKNIKEARGKLDGLCVVAFFLKVTEKNPRTNNRFNLVVHHLTKLRSAKSEEPAEPNILTCLKPIATPGDYFFYYGSLTTKPFSENVLWIVYPKWASVTESQVDEFRRIRGAGNKVIKSNYRETQDLNGRTVYWVTATNDEYTY